MNELNEIAAAFKQLDEAAKNGTISAPIYQQQYQDEVLNGMQQTPLLRTLNAIAASGTARLATRSPAQLHALVSLTVHEYASKEENQSKPMDIVEQAILNHPYSLCFRALCLELDGDTEHNDKFITKWILRCLGNEIKLIE